MERLTATKISQKLNVSVSMLNIWYYWYNNPEFVKPKDVPLLPAYEQATPRAPRYWKSDDLKDLRKFQKWIPKGRGGVMGEATRRYRGARQPKKKLDL